MFFLYIQIFQYANVLQVRKKRFNSFSERELRAVFAEFWLLEIMLSEPTHDHKLDNLWSFGKSNHQVSQACTILPHAPDMPSAGRHTSALALQHPRTSV